MADSSIDSAIQRLEDTAAISASLDNVIAKSIFIPITAFFTSLAGLIYSIFAVPITVMDAFGEAGGLLIDSLFGGAANFVDVSWQTSAQAWMSGVWNQFGPFTILIAAAIFLAIFYMFARYRAMDVTGNVLPGFSDVPSFIPLIGQDEDESS